MLKEADIDSEGNEFHSCKSEEEIIGSSLVEQEELKNEEDEWSDASDERPKKKRKSKAPRH